MFQAAEVKVPQSSPGRTSELLKASGFHDDGEEVNQKHPVVKADDQEPVFTVIIIRSPRTSLVLLHVGEKF